MSLKEYFDNIDLNEIQRFIDEGQEENITLEFKTVNHPTDPKGNDKKNISKVISGFANSIGGIIIWGIKASKNDREQDIAKETKPIVQLTSFLNRLNTLEGQSVTPIVSGIVHKKIEINNSDIGYIKTFIPASQRAPHMALYCDNHYFKRSGDSFYRCEHYDIKDMFSRTISPILVLRTKIQRKEFDNYTTIYKILLSIENQSPVTAKYPFLAFNLSSPYIIDRFGLDGNGTCGLDKVKNNFNYIYNYSGGINTVIHPYTILDLDLIYLSVKSSNEVKDLKISFMLSSDNMISISDNLVISSKEIIAESL